MTGMHPCSTASSIRPLHPQPGSTPQNLALESIAPYREVRSSVTVKPSLACVRVRVRLRVRLRVGVRLRLKA